MPEREKKKFFFVRVVLNDVRGISYDKGCERHEFRLKDKMLRNVHETAAASLYFSLREKKNTACDVAVTPGVLKMAQNVLTLETPSITW